MLVQRAAQAATQRVEGLSDRLTGVAENGGELRLRQRSQGEGDEETRDEDEQGGGGDCSAA